MNDIVQELERTIRFVDNRPAERVCRMAAAEIETLRAQLAAAEKEITDAHAALAEMPVEPFRSIGGQTWDLAARIRHADGMWRVADDELAAMRERVEKAEAHANKNARKALGCDLIVSVFEKAASGELTPMQKVHIDTEVALDWVDRAKKAESHILTLAEECWAWRAAEHLRISEPHAEFARRADARAATDAAGSLAFAAGIKERKETGNAE